MVATYARCRRCLCGPHALDDDCRGQAHRTRRCHTRPSTAKIPLPRRRFWLRVAMNRTVAVGRRDRRSTSRRPVQAVGSCWRAFNVFSSIAWVPFFSGDFAGGLVATARSGRFEIGLSGGQLIEQCLGLPQVERVETLGEPAVDWGENVTRLGAATLFRPEAGECGRRP